MMNELRAVLRLRRTLALAVACVITCSCATHARQGDGPLVPDVYLEIRSNTLWTATVDGESVDGEGDFLLDIPDYIGVCVEMKKRIGAGGMTLRIQPGGDGCGISSPYGKITICYKTEPACTWGTG